MTNPQLILAILTGVLSNVESGIALLRSLGVGEAADELERIKAEVNASAAKLVPSEALALALFAQVTAGKVIAKIDTLPPVARCPNVNERGLCGNVLTIHVEHGLKWTACDRPGCGFDSRSSVPDSQDSVPSAGLVTKL